MPDRGDAPDECTDLDEELGDEPALPDLPLPALFPTLRATSMDTERPRLRVEGTASMEPIPLGRRRGASPAFDSILVFLLRGYTTGEEAKSW
jgi:hypothetical protein